MLTRAHRTTCVSTLAAAALIGCSLTLASPAQAHEALDDGFESGVASGWSSSNVDVSPEFARSEAFGARAVANPWHAGYLTWSGSAVTQGMRYGRVGGWVRVESAAEGQSVDVITLQNAHGSRHFDLFRDPWTGRWKYDLFRADSAVSTMTADLGQWYFVEALVDFGGVDGTTYRADVRIDGTDQPSISSTEQVGTTVQAAWFGGRGQRKTNTRYYDDLAVDVSSTPLSFTR